MIDRRPAIVVRPANAADVVTALRFGRDADLVIAVRSGGHSIPGLSTCDDGIVIDLSRMRGVTVDPSERVARCNGGALLGELDDAAQAFGLACNCRHRLAHGRGGPDAGRRHGPAPAQAGADHRRAACRRAGHGRRSPGPGQRRRELPTCSGASWRRRQLRHRDRLRVRPPADRADDHPRRPHYPTSVPATWSRPSATSCPPPPTTLMAAIVMGVRSRSATTPRPRRPAHRDPEHDLRRAAHGRRESSRRSGARAGRLGMPRPADAPRVAACQRCGDGVGPPCLHQERLPRLAARPARGCDGRARGGRAGRRRVLHLGVRRRGRSRPRRGDRVHRSRRALLDRRRDPVGRPGPRRRTHRMVARRHRAHRALPGDGRYVNDVSEAGDDAHGSDRSTATRSTTASSRSSGPGTPTTSSA